jgi:ATP-dependent DNA helicase RecQ
LHARRPRLAAHRPRADPHDVFGYAAFRDAQAEIVEHVTGGGDALVLMPTGGGKSLCYPGPGDRAPRRRARRRAGRQPADRADARPGRRARGGRRPCRVPELVARADEARTIEREMMGGRLVLLYAAPERITTPRFLAQLDSLHERGLLSLFAIDEAHCVSQWGHDFREDYLGLNVLHERYADVPRSR